MLTLFGVKVNEFTFFSFSAKVSYYLFELIVMNKSVVGFLGKNMSLEFSFAK